MDGMQDLDYAYYERVLREVDGSAVGRPDTVWIVGEHSEDENGWVKRLKEERDNVQTAVSRPPPTPRTNASCGIVTNWRPGHVLLASAPPIHGEQAGSCSYSAGTGRSKRLCTK